MKNICVYCGSGTGKAPVYQAAAEALGKAMVRRDIGLVYGGARIGLMGAIADAVLEAGGEAVGIIPTNLVEREVAHDGLSELIVVESMHERKALMAQRSDGFIAMPGGLGTFEELFEILTWAQLGLHTKPIAVYNVAGYYDRLLAFVDQAVAQGFIQTANRGMLLEDTQPDALLSSMAAYRAPDVAPVLKPEQT